MRIDLVKWLDADNDDGTWKAKHELADPDTVVISVGHVVKETEKHLTLAMDYQPGDDTTSCRGRIPLGMIVSRETIYGEGEDK